MGYTTDFIGEIKPDRELTASQISLMQKLFNFDPRGGDYSADSPYSFYYIDLGFNEDYSGFLWNGAEKSYGMVEQVQYVIDEFRKEFPEVNFNGEFMCQGEEYDDRWKLVVKNNEAKKIPIVLKGKKTICPVCGEEYILEEEN